MLLPNGDQAIIPPEKLRDYVLSSAHPVGRFKAAFFATLGYRQESWQELADDVRTQILPLAVASSETTSHGTKNRIVGVLRGPSGRSATIVSVWIVRTNEREPRLVTLFPGESK